MSQPQSDGVPVSDPQGVAPGATLAAARTPDPWITRRELIAAGIAVGGLAVVGVALGPIWAAISPRGHGFVFMPGGVVPDENEALVASDARFVILTCAVGLVAGLAMWFWRSVRGPTVALGLAVGGLLGALLTNAVGHAVGGGHDSGPLNSTIKLPVEVRGHGLVLAEAALALLVYAVGALFTKRDDLNRSPVAAPQRPPPPQPTRSAP